MTIQRGDVRQRLRARWQQLIDQYLPVDDVVSIWRYSRPPHPGDVDQGWKLHVSATVLNAAEILQRVAPLLTERGVQFKTARTLEDVLKLNTGLLDTYSQVGKIITVYPRDDREAVSLARSLHQLTYRFRSPAVPFDLRFRPRTNVYYRYGAFKKLEVVRNGEPLPAIVSPSGELVPDLRDNPKPDWVSDPFPGLEVQPKKLIGKTENPFLILRALVQRGKGGVYQAIDTNSQPPRLCLLKEGRQRGEVNFDGRDGAWRVRHEQRVLSELAACGIRVPKIYSRFNLSGNVYLTMEFVDGVSLHHKLAARQRRLSVESVMVLGLQLAQFLEKMHGAGWAWRDCKPSNLLVTAAGEVVPIDFEGAERINRPDGSLWGTPGYIPRTSLSSPNRRGRNDDVFALGSILFLMLTGRMYHEEQPIPISRLRRHVPFELRELVDSLLDANSQRRPSAQTVHCQLRVILQQRSRANRPLVERQAA